MPVQRGGQVLRVQGRVWADSGFGLEVVNGASGDGEVRWFGSRSIILGQVLIAERIAGNDDGLRNYGGDEARLDACAGLATLAPGFFSTPGPARSKTSPASMDSPSKAVVCSATQLGSHPRCVFLDHGAP